ncbi:hypothetical protein HYX17_03440 [Candidatus Woesearchaeota archaeon]|nr:hypothetical protein [Candidatus Woesearchaeota archaeon]
MYKERLIESFKSLKFLLFVPDLAMLIISFLLGLSFVKYSGITEFFNANNNLIDSLDMLIPLLSDFIQDNILVFVIYLILFFITGFILGSGINAMKFGMMRDIIEKKKLEFKKMIGYGSKYFWDIVLMRLTVFIISLMVLLFFGILIILNALNTFYSQIFFNIILLLFLITLFFLSLLLLFRYPALLIDRKNPIEIIKSLYLLLLKNFKHVFMTWFIIFLFGLIILLLDFSLNIAYGATLMIILIIIRYAISLIYGVWSNLFLFYMYKLK